MAVTVECISIVIPIDRIGKKCSEAVVEACLEAARYGGACCQDGYLFRESFMNPLDAQLRIEWWKGNGLRPTKTRKGVVEWNDLCVVDSFEGPTLPCGWICYDSEKQAVWLAGMQGGDVTRQP